MSMVVNVGATIGAWRYQRRRRCCSMIRLTAADDDDLASYESRAWNARGMEAVGLLKMGPLHCL